jgi:hypothetical protein
MNKLTQWIFIALLAINSIIGLFLLWYIKQIKGNIHNDMNTQYVQLGDIKDILSEQQQTLKWIDSNTWELQDVLLDDFSYYMKQILNK